MAFPLKSSLLLHVSISSLRASFTKRLLAGKAPASRGDREGDQGGTHAAQQEEVATQDGDAFRGGREGHGHDRQGRALGFLGG